MGELSKIVFTPRQEKEVEVLGHKVVFRGLTTRDTLEMNWDYAALTDKEADQNPKLMLKNMIEMLAPSIVSIDGAVPENKAEAMEFLLNQNQATVIELFSKSSIVPSTTAEEIKN